MEAMKHDPEEMWIQSMIQLEERRRKEEEIQLDLNREAELIAEGYLKLEPDVILPEIVPFEAISDWNTYRGH